MQDRRFDKGELHAKRWNGPATHDQSPLDRPDQRYTNTVATCQNARNDK